MNTGFWFELEDAGDTVAGLSGERRRGRQQGQSLRGVVLFHSADSLFAAELVVRAL